MPELPIPEQLGRRVFQDRSQVVRPSIDMSGQQDFANAVNQFASGITDRLDRSSMLNAKIQFQKMKLEADSAFDKDNDFETYEQRYSEMLKKAADESSKLIRNQRLKDQFQTEISLYQAEGIQNIRKRALSRETDQGLANLDSSITAARENYLRANNPLDRQLAREALDESINVAEQNAYIDADKAQQLRRSAAVDLAIASVKIESPQRQIKLLKENKGLIDVIPTDVRMKMIEDAESQSQNDTALILAGEIRSKGGDRKTRLDEADKVKDPKTRELVRQQVEIDINREKRAVADRQYDAYDSLKKEVLTGRSPLEVSRANPTEWNAMSADQQQAILSLSSGKNKTTDIETYNKLNRLAAEDKEQAYTYFKENAYKLSDADQKKWSDRLAKPEELDGYLTRTRRLEVSLSTIGIDDKKSDRYKLAEDQLDQDVIDFQKEKGREPNAEELDKLINRITDKVVESSWINPFSRDQYGFNLTREQRAARSQDKKMSVFEQRLGEYTAYLQGDSDVPVVLPDEEINKLYRAWDRAGLLDAD